MIKLLKSRQEKEEGSVPLSKVITRSYKRPLDSLRTKIKAVKKSSNQRTSRLERRETESQWRTKNNKNKILKGEIHQKHKRKQKGEIQQKQIKRGKSKDPKNRIKYIYKSFVVDRVTDWL